MIKNFHPKKSLGQNFLKDPHYLKRIVDAADILSADQVLEIGPGLGHLTKELAERAKKVLALELDERLITPLQQEFKDQPHIEIVHADALEYSYASLQGKWKVVANLPYYISTPIIQKLLVDRQKFISLTLMLQKEVAARICAPPGGKEYGFLSVLVQLYAEPKIEFIVPAAAFTPKPDVDSAVITLGIRDTAPIMIENEAFFMRLVKAAFSQRRKTLRNALKQLDLPQEKMKQVLEVTGIDLDRRAETLSVEDYGKLASFFQKKP
ncbi:MAG: 16S rRNA (adenine(1518)-N(6)/adenine(1519)-N(6))-dimethyltransferase RsmA [Nitrospirota bacterium]